MATTSAQQVSREQPQTMLGSTEETKANGPALAALLAAGIGCAVLGILTTLAAANADFSKLLVLNQGVGPLSGKTTYAVAAYLVSWNVLAYLMRGKRYYERPFFIATFALIGIGLLGTFPICFDLFAK